MRVAVLGKLRSGKTEVANILEENRFEVMDFSDALKDCLKILYPYLDKEKKNRELLISVGQHLRALDEDIWVNILKHRILSSKSENVLIMGVRQANEYEMLKSLGFKFIKIEANPDIRIERCINNNDIFSPETLNHYTETLLDDFEVDYMIKNEGTLEELRRKVLIVLNNILVNDDSEGKKHGN